MNHNWPQILTAIIAIYGAIMSTIVHRQNKKRDVRSERILRSTVISETTKSLHHAKIIDDWIKKDIFTQKQILLVGIRSLIEYWRANEALLSEFLGRKSACYLQLKKIYLFLLKNERNEQPPDGRGTWIGVEDLGIIHVEASIRNTLLILERDQS